MLCVSCRFGVRDDLIKKSNEEKTIIGTLHTKILFSVVLYIKYFLNFI